MDNRKLNNLHVTIASLQGEYISLAEPDEAFHRQRELSPVHQFRNPVHAARELVRKWSRVQYASGKDYVPVREVSVSLTLTGGPDSYGMVSLY